MARLTLNLDDNGTTKSMSFSASTDGRVEVRMYDDNNFAATVKYFTLSKVNTLYLNDFLESVISNTVSDYKNSTR